jgi:hypothetical protein
VLRGKAGELANNGRCGYVEDTEDDVIVVRFERRTKSND